MKEIRCPFCGRENTRGRYCMFCGNPLAGGKAVTTDREKAAKQDADQRWDPETVYVRSRGRAIAILAGVLVLIACAAVVFLSQTRAPAKPWRAFAAPLGTPDATSLQEMTDMLTEAGMKTIGSPFEFNGRTSQQFAPFVILDENTIYSEAVIRGGEEIAVSHAFTEEEGVYTIRRQGPVFERMKEKLTKKYGQPVIRGTQDYYYWSQQGDLLILYYARNGEIRLEFHEGIRGTSV